MIISLILYLLMIFRISFNSTSPQKNSPVEFSIIEKPVVVKPETDSKNEFNKLIL